MSSQHRPPQSRSARLALESLEDRTTPTFLPRPGPQLVNVNGVTIPTGGLSIAAGDVLPDPGNSTLNEYVTGTGPGTEGLVRVWRLNGTNKVGQNFPALTIDPFPGFTGGINVAVGDVTGDGKMEIIAAVGSFGPPHVKVFDSNGRLLSSFYAFNPAFLGGVNIAVGNVLGGIGSGGFPGGATSSNFKQEIIIGAAAGDTPHVVVADGSGTILRSFLAFDLHYRGGVTVAAANIDSDRTPEFFDPNTGTGTFSDSNAYDEIVVGAATNVPHVKVFDVWTGAIDQRLSFYAFDPRIPGGVTVAAGSTDGIAGAEIFVSQITQAPLHTAPSIRVFDSLAQAQYQITPFPADYSHVLNMTVAYIRGPYDPRDDDDLAFFPNHNPAFLTQDLAIVAGDGPYLQQPRIFIGRVGSPAGLNGP
jgi:hypothetical protein